MIPLYIIRSRTSLALASFSFILIMGLVFYGNYLRETTQTLQNRLVTLKNLTARSQEMVTFIQTHPEDFAAFEECQFERPLTPETLKAAFNYDITFGPKSAVNGTPNNNRWIAQEVSFSIPCVRDRDVLSVLARLIHQGPGIFRIREIEISRVNPLTEDGLRDIGSGKSQVLFQGKIAALWIHR